MSSRDRTFETVNNYKVVIKVLLRCVSSACLNSLHFGFLQDDVIQTRFHTLFLEISWRIKIQVKALKYANLTEDLLQTVVMTHVVLTHSGTSLKPVITSSL